MALQGWQAVGSVWGAVMPDQKRGRGRPKGKKSDPDYTQIAPYIRLDTYRAMRHRLIDSDMEISELIQELLDRWLREGK